VSFPLVRPNSKLGLRGGTSHPSDSDGPFQPPKAPLMTSTASLPSVDYTPGLSPGTAEPTPFSFLYATYRDLCGSGHWILRMAAPTNRRRLRCRQNYRHQLHILHLLRLYRDGRDLNDIVSHTRTFSDHPTQFKINGKVFVSSYARDCLGMVAGRA
jgi:hypothetical protein